MDSRSQAWTASGDCDGNGAVDLSDFASFDACFSGPSTVMGGGCDCFDFTQDGHVDMSDFAAFQSYFTGN